MRAYKIKPVLFLEVVGLLAAKKKHYRKERRKILLVQSKNKIYF